MDDCRMVTYHGNLRVFREKKEKKIIRQSFLQPVYSTNICQEIFWESGIRIQINNINTNEFE